MSLKKMWEILRNSENEKEKEANVNKILNKGIGFEKYGFIPGMDRNIVPDAIFLAIPGIFMAPTLGPNQE